MRAKTVNENVSFERGRDPKESIGIGMIDPQARQRLREGKLSQTLVDTYLMFLRDGYNAEPFWQYHQFDVENKHEITISFIMRPNMNSFDLSVYDIDMPDMGNNYEELKEFIGTLDQEWEDEMTDEY